MRRTNLGAGEGTRNWDYRKGLGTTVCRSGPMKNKKRNRDRGLHVRPSSHMINELIAQKNSMYEEKQLA